MLPTACDPIRAARPHRWLLHLPLTIVIALTLLLFGAQAAGAVAPPTVTGVNPASGPVAGGNQVVLTGADFTGATAVTFGLNGAFFMINSNTSITAIAPGSAGIGIVNVFVTTGNGTSTATLANRYTYVAGAPVVTDVNPDFGPVNGGNTVSIAGAGFTGATNVSFGGASALFIVNNNNSITAVAPAYPTPGTVNVRVTTGNGTSVATAANQYTYISQAPIVFDLNPSSGPVTGGTVVRISGSGFLGAVYVTFGSVPASFIVNSDTQITATAPAASSPGVVIVRVTNLTATSAANQNSQYTYVSARPTVTSLSPSSGPVDGGTSVTIRGVGFNGATSVFFGAIPAKFVVNSDTQITALAPAVGGTGAVDVRVTTPAGTNFNTSADNYSYTGPVYCPTPPFWIDDLAYGSPGGGFYWDPVSGLVWTAQRPWHLFSPQPPRLFSKPMWADALTYGSAGGGFYWDSVSGLVWTAERGWHRYSPQGCVLR